MSDRAARRPPAWGDLLLTFLVSGFVLGATSSAAQWQDGTGAGWGNAPEIVATPLDAFGYAWLLAAVLPLLLARRFPAVVTAVTAALALTYYWTDYPGGPIAVSPAIALFTLTRLRGVVPGSVAGGALVLLSYAGLVASSGNWLPSAGSIGFVAGVVAVIGVGAAVRARGAATRAAKEQAAEHEQRLAEQERLRIAREVHDVVAHSLAMINVQAGVAAHVADRRPEQAKEALRNIKEASASALTDLRATLAVLRTGQDKAPMPSLRQLSELLEHARSAGLTVRVHGDPGELPAPTDAAAYRILQESLTNVVRHANQPSTVDIRFSRSRTRLVLTVTDDGHGATAPKIGNGLRGMRERTDVLGGSVLAEPVAQGFRVRAELPVNGGKGTD